MAMCKLAEPARQAHIRMTQPTDHPKTRDVLLVAANESGNKSLMIRWYTILLPMYVGIICITDATHNCVM